MSNVGLSAQKTRKIEIKTLTPMVDKSKLELAFLLPNEPSVRRGSPLLFDEDGVDEGQ